jgi:hypothetical protein
MIKAIKQALTRDGKFPLTLVVIDEVQQYIGEDSQRSIDVQETVEACSKNIGAKMLFIGTGQTAVNGTSNLKKLEGRFTVRVELSDADVDAVIRQVILAKKPEAKKEEPKAAPAAKPTAIDKINDWGVYAAGVGKAPAVVAEALELALALPREDLHGHVIEADALLKAQAQAARRAEA